MLKLGVCRADQYAPLRGGLLEWLRRDHVDYRLLRTADPPSSVEVRLFESLTRHLELRGGVYRTTSQARFRDLDSWLMPLLLRHFDTAGVVDAQDWAASDCVASLAWHDQLIATFPRLRFVASDVTLHLVEMQVAEGSYVFEEGADVLQFVSPPFVIRLNPGESPFLIVNRLLARRALSRLTRLRRSLGVEPAAVQFPAGVDEVQHGPLRFRKIPLVHPQVVAARARVADSFHVECHSVFQRATQPAHMIRTMNILSTRTFSRPMLERATRSVFQTLVPGGLWVLGRTMEDHPPLHHVSVLVKTEDGFRVLERYNQKSEIEDLALAVGA
jgi:hypothetical protein